MNRSSVMRIYAMGASVIVIAAVAAAMTLVGSPAQQRQRRFDEQRERDLAAIDSAIRVYVRAHDALPANLAALGAQPGPRPVHSDPETAVGYEYNVTDTSTYTLCAVFALPSDTNANTAYAAGNDWNHAAGRQCFDRKQHVDKN